jgi:hypothetical protein
MVFGNRVMRNMLRAETDAIKGGWRKLHNEELHNLCYSPSTIRMIKRRRMKWERHVDRMGRRRTKRILMRKPEGKGPLGKCR